MSRARRSRAWWLAAAAVAVASTAAVGWRVASPAPPARAARGDPGARATTARPAAPRTREARRPKGSRLSGAPPRRAGASLLRPSPSRRLAGPALPSARRALASYLRSAKYPPTSRPLSEASVDLIEWNRRHERARPGRDDPNVEILFTGDRYWVTGSEAITTRLTVRRAGRPVVPRSVVAAVRAVHPVTGAVDALRGAVALTYVESGDGLVSTFAPGDRFGQEPVRLRIGLRLDVGGSAERAALDFAYTPPAALPARFTGRFTDSVIEGSLVVGAGVVVDRPGYYLVDCNLYDAAGRPVAWTRYKGDLGRETRSVPLRFFGKAIVDAEPTPPFHLGELRGGRYVEGHDPDLERMPTFEGDYETGPYALEDFSDDEWDSPQKRRKVAALTEMASTE